MRTAINPTRAENYAEWYQQVIKHAELAENSPVRGCMVIRPWGYAIWENIQKHLDKMFKDTGHENAYFPLLIPVSFLEKEAEHVEGFAKECAVVTHHRLEDDGQGGLKPAGELEEPFVIRPTSETIIGAAYAKWVQSYRDLPILINQWANVMRWEMRTRLFLRTSEFLWQEGHTAHATKQEAIAETLKMLAVYEDFATRFLAIPVIKGEKTKDERFPGAVDTYSIEAMMQDGRALQAGTSHFLGQNFAKASGISFTDKQGEEVFAWTTSWGVSTRLIGALIMSHSDDDGLVLPPMIAPKQIVLIPIYNNEDDHKLIVAYCHELIAQLEAKQFNNEPIRVLMDDRDMRGGERFWSQVKKGVPLRVEVGKREVDNKTITISTRDKSAKDKSSLASDRFIQEVQNLLTDVQAAIYNKALKFRDQHTKIVQSVAQFHAHFDNPNNKGFVICYSDPDTVSEKRDEILNQFKVSARCIASNPNNEEGICIFTGQATTVKIIYAKAY
jgi:prolyl-tRNA synthetase